MRYGAPPFPFLFCLLSERHSRLRFAVPSSALALAAGGAANSGGATRDGGGARCERRAGRRVWQDPQLSALGPLCLAWQSSALQVHAP